MILGCNYIKLSTKLSDALLAFRYLCHWPVMLVTEIVADLRHSLRPMTNEIELPRPRTWLADRIQGITDS